MLILDQFSNISGLHCNFDKTSILAIHEPTQEERDAIADSGFQLVKKIKLLGATITSEYDDIYDNFDAIIEKVRNLILFWSRFKLSLPGRITIAKTFLLSQVNYLGSVFLPRTYQIDTLQLLINNFIKKTLTFPTSGQVTC
jgi:hypothetical protein